LLIGMTAYLFAALCAAADESAPFTVKGPVRAGPDILYAPPAISPQLSNTGIWKAPPILVSGVSAYRDGEFLYQDYLYDDRGASHRALYPSDLKAKTGDNAADYVEIRIKLGRDSTAIRISYNTLLDAEVVASTIALGDAVTAAHIPFGGGGTEPATIFVTVHGKTGVITEAASGSAIGTARVTVDMLRRQVDVRVPFSAFDPRGKTVRIAAATGLWDAATGAYRTPDDPPAPPPPEPGATAPARRPLPPLPATRAVFFNVAFRYHEPLNVDSMLPFYNDVAQAEALTKGDLSPFYAEVDFAKLSKGVTDDSQIPTRGFTNRIIASHFESAQGRGSALRLDKTCQAPCIPQFAGRLQPYEIYVPEKTPPASGYGLTLDLHSADATYARWIGQSRQVELGERGTGSIVITPFGRGTRGGYYGQSGADVFEVWNDVARRYKVDPDYVSLAGVSMGAMGSFKFAGQFPDLFAAAAVSVGCPSDPVLLNHRLVPFMLHTGDKDNLTNCHPGNPVLEKWLALNQPYLWWNFLNHPHPFSSIPRNWQPFADYLGMKKRAADPPHVVYAMNQDMVEPRYGLNSDHAYWLSGITIRDPRHLMPSDPTNPVATAIPPAFGIVDVFSHGMGKGDPTPNPVVDNSGVFKFGVDSYPWPNYNSQQVTWGTAAPLPVANVLDITAQNIATLTIDPKRVKIDCDATVNVRSDGPIQVKLLGCRKINVVKVSD
jgi:pimeloyl-ACP methyl ester carboxylesterase